MSLVGDGLALTGAAFILYGISLWSVPASIVLAGCMVAGLGVWVAKTTAKSGGK